MPTSRINFAWDANTEPDISTYKLYAGRALGVYDDANSPKDMGNVISGSYEITASGTWYFALKARNTSNLDGGFSNEVTRSWVLASNF